MIFPSYFETKKSLQLFGLNDSFNLLKSLYTNKKLPNALMLSGEKGSGKSTLINHLLFFIFDNQNYNEENNQFKNNSLFYNQFLDNIFSNIIYLSGSEFKNVKIEDIRNLKKKIFQSTILDKPRFIIFDDVELFNNNSLNALLKIIEEPSDSNFFCLINNKSKPLIDTIKSRCLEFKVILNEQERTMITHSLIDKYKIDLVFDQNHFQLSPGHFIKFNYIFTKNKISLEGDFIKNLSLFLDLYKKNKDAIYMNIISFLIANYFKSKKNYFFSKDKLIENKRYVFDNINKFFLYNLNQNALLNNIDNKINNE